MDRSVNDRVRAFQAASRATAGLQAQYERQTEKRSAAAQGGEPKRDRKSVREKVRRDEVKLAFKELADLLGCNPVVEKAHILAEAGREIAELRAQSNMLIRELHRLHEVRFMMDRAATAQFKPPTK